MKRRIVILLLTVAAMCFATVTAAAADRQAGEGEFSFVTLHQTKHLVQNDDDFDGLVVAMEWIAQNADALRIKGVGLLGNLTSSSKTKYADYVTAQGHTMAEYVAFCQNEEGWKNEIERLTGALQPLSTASIPVTLASGKLDYPGEGINRGTIFANYFSPMNWVPEKNKLVLYDSINNYYLFDHDGVQYMVLTLEWYPRQAVLDWADKVISENPQARVIVLTNSFLSPSGEMYVMWDWSKKAGMTNTEFQNQYMKAEGVTTAIRSVNIAWDNNPRDGDGLWEYSLKKHDNLFMIINSNSGGAAYDGKKIVHRVFRNEAGYDVLAIVADTEKIYAEYGVCPVVTSVKDKGKTVSFSYYSTWDGWLEGTGAEVTLRLKDVEGFTAEPVKPKLKLQTIGENTAYIKGYEGNTFRPQNNMTRAEACTIIARLLDSEESFRGVYQSAFSDVKADQWYYDYIAYLEHFGFLTRYTGAFEPDTYITRAQFVDLAYLAGGFYSSDTGAYFTDVPEGHSYYKAILSAANSGLVNGYEDSTFRPDNTITRAEVVTIINRILNIVPMEKDITGANVNIFADIAGHWAYYNIIMASNSNVVSGEYAKIDMTGITENDRQIIVENDYVRYILDKNSAMVMGFIDKATGKDIRSNGGAPHFCYLYSESGAKSIPLKIALVNNRLEVLFADLTKLYFIAQAKDTYLTFELDSTVPRKYKSLSFAVTGLSYNLANENEFSAIGYSMTYWTDMYYYPDAKNMQIRADCFSKFQTRGAKLAVIAAPKNEHRDIMKQVNSAMVKGDSLISSIGGPNALDHEENYGDYVIVSDSDPAKLPEWIELCTTYGVDQLDFHRGGNTFLNGSFTFRKVKDGADFKKKISDPLREIGVLSGLHTYAYYVEASDTATLSNPYWQKQLGVKERFTLTENVGKFAVTLNTKESTKDVSHDFSFFVGNSKYLLVDEEIMIYTATGENSFTVQRGACGTAAATHSAGAEIRHLDGCFGMLAPDPDSELFLQVARNTAKAYNEGGFAMIYLDALDGMNRHVPADEVWYYNARFVNEIMKYCETDPIMEYSSMYPSIWTARNRMGAQDYPRLGYKGFIDSHVQSNLAFVDRYFPTTLGWYNLYPLDSYEGNTNIRYEFFDDVDYIGSMCIAYDMGMVHQGTEQLSTVPAFKKNILQYNNYAKLRKTKYFSESIKKQIREGKYEYAITQKADGSWVFVEKSYSKTKLYDIGTQERSTIAGTNPFGAQKPFIRIEGHYSVTGDDVGTLIAFDETKDLQGQPMSITFAKELDLKDNRVFKVKVYGNNSGGAICFRLACNSDGDSAVADYIIRLDFEGWREFVLAERDNGAFPDVKFSGKSDAGYAYYRGTFQYHRVTAVNVYTTGDLRGVKMSSITYAKQTENALINPTVTIAGKSVTFQGTIGASEYLEYFPGDSAAKIYDRIGNARDAAVTGELGEIPAGSYSAILSAEKSIPAAQRATVTFGFTGNELK